LRASLELGHHYIGTGHLLLGLISEGHGVAITVLDRLGANLDQLRERVILELETETEPEDPGHVLGAGRQVKIARRQQIRWPSQDAIQARLEKIDERLSAVERHLGIVHEDPEPGGDSGAGEDSGDGGDSGG
jgi:ATP-dependent Clp protease ATP-binding subunit ClpA